MMILINGGPPLDRFGVNPLLGRLISPRCGNLVRPGERWAGDNDAYSGFDEALYLRMLAKHARSPDCLFVTIPDVVADSAATLENFPQWRDRVAAFGYPIAFVGQDGCDRLPIPWDRMDAFFVGGSTEFKVSPTAFDLCREAKARGKWVHMGRVNTMERIRIAADFGCDSIDGTGWSRFPDHYLRRHLPRVEEMNRQPLLF